MGTGPTDPDPNLGGNAPVVAGIGAVAGVEAARRTAAFDGTTGIISTQTQALRTHATTMAGFGDNWRDRIWQLGSTLRYSSRDDSDPLEHDARRTLFTRLTEEPGVYLTALAEETDMSMSAVRHHLRVLESEDLIRSVKFHGKRRFYPTDEETVRLHAALDDEAAAAILRTLGRRGSMSGMELAEALDRHPSTVTYHLKRLADAGFVTREREGRAVVNRVTPDVRETLHQVTNVDVLAEEEEEEE